MAKRLTTEDQLACLRRLRQEEPSPANLAELERLLREPRAHGMAIRGAAELAERWAARSLASALGAAAQHLSPEALGGDAQKRDPGCEGKEAALRALITWEADFPDLFLAASAWKQHAPIMNGSKDVAAECRGLAALGIAQTRGGLAGADAAVTRLIDLLADPEAATRVRAAQALGMWRGPEAAPVLRLKAHLGDEQPQVIAETLAALLRQDARGQLPFVAGFLQHDDTGIVEAAALALGESRELAALAPLTAAYSRLARDPVHTSVLMAIALLRQEDSLAWLLQELGRARPSTVPDVLQALRLYRGDNKAVARIQAALGSPDARRAFEELFG
jgi:hypothetical protein